MTAALQAVTQPADLFGLEPLARFQTLIAGPNFPDYLRSAPIMFDLHDPIFGYACGIPGCGLHASLPNWCSPHRRERYDALRSGIGEAAWKAAAIPFPARGARTSPPGGLPACRFCPDRDAARDGLCLTHAGMLAQATKRSVRSFDYDTWAARQVPLSGAGGCRVLGCVRRAEKQPGLCLNHRIAWVRLARPTGKEMQAWLARAGGDSGFGVVSLTGLAPLLAAEIRYALWAHTVDATPGAWHPMWMRTLVTSCRQREVGSLLEVDHRDAGWSTHSGPVNRIVQAMRRDVEPVHHSRDQTRQMGYLDTDYWGFRFPQRRSVFDLSAIAQTWLRDLTWQHLADVLDGPNRPRSQGPFDAVRRAAVAFGDYLRDCDPHGGHNPAALTAATARGFVADYTRRIGVGEPVRGMVNSNGSSTPASKVSYALTLNALRRLLRTAMDNGTTAAIGLPREFIVTIPFGGSTVTRNPRPFSDEVLRAVSDPTNIALLNAMDPHDNGLADIWSIQVRCGRRISEVVGLRFDCVSEHLGRTWLWVDMTKVGKLDYAIQIPRDVYDLILARQQKTARPTCSSSAPIPPLRNAASLRCSPAGSPTPRWNGLLPHNRSPSRSRRGSNPTRCACPGTRPTRPGTRWPPDSSPPGPA